MKFWIRLKKFRFGIFLLALGVCFIFDLYLFIRTVLCFVIIFCFGRFMTKDLWLHKQISLTKRRRFVIIPGDSLFRFVNFYRVLRDEKCFEKKCFVVSKKCFLVTSVLIEFWGRASYFFVFGGIILFLFSQFIFRYPRPSKIGKILVKMVKIGWVFFVDHQRLITVFFKYRASFLRLYSAKDHWRFSAKF